MASESLSSECCFGGTVGLPSDGAFAATHDGPRPGGPRWTECASFREDRSIGPQMPDHAGQSSGRRLADSLMAAVRDHLIRDPSLVRVSDASLGPGTRAATWLS